MKIRWSKVAPQAALMPAVAVTLAAICRLADKFWNTPGMTEEQGVAEFQKAYDSVF